MNVVLSGRDCKVHTATSCGLESPGIESMKWRGFPWTSVRLRILSSLLYNAYQVLSKSKMARALCLPSNTSLRRVLSYTSTSPLCLLEGFNHKRICRQFLLCLYFHYFIFEVFVMAKWKGTFRKHSSVFCLQFPVFILFKRNLQTLGFKT